MSMDSILTISLIATAGITGVAAYKKYVRVEKLLSAEEKDNDKDNDLEGDIEGFGSKPEDVVFPPPGAELHGENIIERIGIEVMERHLQLDVLSDKAFSAGFIDTAAGFLEVTYDSPVELPRDERDVLFIRDSYTYNVSIGSNSNALMFKLMDIKWLKSVFVLARVGSGTDEDEFIVDHIKNVADISRVPGAPLKSITINVVGNWSVDILETVMLANELIKGVDYGVNVVDDIQSVDFGESATILAVFGTTSSTTFKELSTMDYKILNYTSDPTSVLLSRIKNTGGSMEPIVLSKNVSEDSAGSNVVGMVATFPNILFVYEQYFTKQSNKGARGLEGNTDRIKQLIMEIARN